MKRKVLYAFLSLMCLSTCAFTLTACRKKTDDTTIKPTLTETKYIVTFDLDGGVGTTPDQQIIKGNKITKPNDPTKEGYSFNGWYYNDSLVDFNSFAVDGNVLLKAKWTINSYILTLNTLSENGEVSGANTYEYNSDVTIKATPKDGYIFNGWYNDGVITNYSQEATFKMPSKNITLEARFIDDPFEYDSENPTIITGLKNKSLTNLVIPEGVTEIYECVFEDCSNLKSITLPNSLTSIGECAFRECTCDIKWSDNPSITIIGKSAFDNYKGTSLTIPNSVTSIGNNAFDSCTSLTSITLPNSITSIGASTFSSCTSLKSVTIPDSVTSIGNSAFYNCFNLTSITIPNSVTSIGEYAFSECTCEIKWEDNPSIKTIDRNAFHIYRGTSITIPNSITSIGEHAFSNCIELTSITIPDSVTSIGEGAFSVCRNLKKVYYKGTSSQWNDIAINSENNSYLKNATRYYYTNNGARETAYGNWWYYDIDGATIIENFEYAVSFDLNDGSGVIGIQRIRKGKNIEKPNDPKRDGYTFDGWYYDGEEWSFTDDVVNDNMTLTATWIANTNTAYKVEHCLQNLDDNKYKVFETENLTGTTDTLTNASTRTYEGFTAPSVTQVNINGNGSTVVVLNYARNTYIVELNKNTDNVGTIKGDGTYAYDKSITITATLPNLSTYTFDGWYLDDERVSINLKYTFNMPSKNISLKARYLDAFNYDSEKPTKITGLKNKSITNLVIPDGVTEIGKEAFKECSKLTYITIPDSVTSIGEAAFYNCTSLTSITIPKNITSIEKYTFVHCTCEIKWKDNSSITTIGENAFGRYEGTSLTIPNTVTSLGEYAFFECTSEILWENNPSITEIGEYAFQDYKGTSITIPNSVTSIGNNAFYNCKGEILFEDNSRVTTIGESAFRNYKGTSLTIPNSITSIGEYAFSECTCEINWGDNPSITEIGKYAFGFYKGTSLTIPNSVKSIGQGAFNICTGLTSLTIPDSVTSIGNSAFNYCIELTSITIPNSVTSVGDKVFYDCRKLTKVYYKGTLSQWNDIGIYLFENDFLIDATHFYYYTNNGASETAYGNWWYYDTDGVTIIEKVVE